VLPRCFPRLVPSRLPSLAAFTPLPATWQQLLLAGTLSVALFGVTSLIITAPSYATASFLSAVAPTWPSLVLQCAPSQLIVVMRLIPPLRIDYMIHLAVSLLPSEFHLVPSFSDIQILVVTKVCSSTSKSIHI
jgi:hypothetical protein